eukprot:GILI01007416.1.p1 GENE.GILI01007416.1~~GILI01007416.1.p1  ORF type:complete len:818 (+),score=128.77 GILI01007416.1:206-2455(+)
MVFTVDYDSGLIVGSRTYTDNLKSSLWSETVPLDYQLTATETAIRCALSPDVGGTTLTKVCKHTIATYGNEVLVVARKAAESAEFSLGNDILVPSTTMILTGKQDVSAPMYTTFSVGKSKYIVSLLKVVADGSTVTPNWLTMVIVNEDEVIGVLGTVRNILIIVTVCLTLFVAIVFIIGARFILAPISDIAELMTVSAYLEEEREIPQSKLKVSKSIKDHMSNRALSRFAEVRAIQESYYALSDELQILKAYIPEHIRSEMMSRHYTKSPSTSSDQMSADVRPLLDDDEGISEMREEDTVFIDASGPELLRQPVSNPLEGPGHESTESPQTPLNVPSPAEAQLEGPPGSQLGTSTPTPPPALQAPRKRLSLKNDEEAPIYFLDSYLIDRDITVVHLNLIGFHQYARRRHPTTISSDYSEFITYINTEVKHYGGVLESFSGDKMWVSFNATSKCVQHQVAACYFAYHVTRVVNETADRYKRALPPRSPADGSKSERPKIDKRFAMCIGGMNAGVSTGRAFVGPLGNSSIKRHNIISNAISEAAALERQSLHYAGCNALISSDMFPYIEGYCQYLLLDTTLLPGSLGKRRRIACLAGPMLLPSANPDVVAKWLKPVGPPPPGIQSSGFEYEIECPRVWHKDNIEGDPTEATVATRSVPVSNTLAPINEGFKAILDGNNAKARKVLKDSKKLSPDPTSLETSAEFEERKAMNHFMAQLIQSFLDRDADGKNYTSALGDVHMPFNRQLLHQNV